MTSAHQRSDRPSIWRRVRRSGQRLLSLVYPPRCPGCRSRRAATLDVDTPAWCDPCAGTVFRPEGPRCSICATPRKRQIGRVYAGVDAVCPRCAQRRPGFEFADSLYEYSGAVADTIQFAKYAPATWPLRHLEAAFGPWLCERLDRLDGPFDLTTVPMHRRDLAHRGFHLARMVLARAARRDRRLRSRVLLTKTRCTPPQAGLTLGERFNNVRGVFETPPNTQLDGRTIVLVDDVMTTGATADAAARALRRAGARRVVVFTIARAAAS